MSQKLFLFQIGPVQAFIAQARRTQDLYIGSRILSELAGAGVRAASRQPGFQPIFPMWDDRQAFPSGAPHRFAFISTGGARAVAEAVHAAVMGEWLDRFAGSVRAWLTKRVGAGDWQTLFDRQARSWLEFNWVAVDYAGDHSGCFQRANAALRARRLSRTIYPIDEPGAKCTLTGAQSALPIGWERLRDALNDPYGIILRKNEKLGALALIKRFAGRDFADCGLNDQRFPSTDEIAGVPPVDEREGKDVRGYLAVLHMDGDRMGKRLSELEGLREHQEFSAALAKFANTSVPSIIGEYQRAALVYAGGDDVLALLPMPIALEVADRLRKEFKKRTDCTASAGIAITPYNLPLDTALELSRKAEERAKEHHGRDAVVITEAHGTGQIRYAGSRWETGGGIAAMIKQVQSHFADHKISGKLAYDVQQIAHDMVGADVPKDAREAELKRLIKRRIGEHVNGERDAILKELTPMLCQFGEDSTCGWDMLANWLILARFMAQGQIAHKERV